MKQEILISAVIGLPICIVIVSAVLVFGRSPSPITTNDAGAAGTPSASARHATVFASFKSGGLDECTELVGRTIGDAASVGDDVVRIDQTCKEAFADRPILATCVLLLNDDDTTAHGQDHPTSSIFANYYDALTLEDDVYMRDCLKNGGKWAAVSRDDVAYKRSRLQGHAKELQRIGDQLSKGQR